MHKAQLSSITDYFVDLISNIPLAEFITSRFLLAAAFVGAFINTGVPAALAALSLISLAIFGIFESRRVQYRKTIIDRVNSCSVPSLDSSQGQQRALLRALAKTGDSLFVVDSDGTVIAAGGDTYESFGKSTEDIVGKKLPPVDPQRLRICETFMVLDSKTYAVVKASKQ